MRALLVTGVIVGVGLWWLTRSEPAPTPPAAKPQPQPQPLPLPLPPGVTAQAYYLVTSQTYPLPTNIPPGAFPSQGFWESKSIAPAAKAAWASQLKVFQARLLAQTKMHPHDTAPSPDKYTTQNYLVFRPINGSFNAVSQTQMWGWGLTDQLGRPYEGWGQSDVLGFTIQLVSTVAWFIPGGAEVKAGLAVAIAIGQGKSCQDIALAAARAQLPPGGQIAFDAAVGVASGKPVDQAALNALEQKYPGAKAAYAQGKALAQKAV